MDSRKNTEAPLESQSALFLPWKVWWYTCHKSYVKMLMTGRAAAQSDQQAGRLGPARPDNAGGWDQCSTDRPRTIKSKRWGRRTPTCTSRPRRGGRAPAEAMADSGTGTQHREQIAPLQLKQRGRPLVGEIPSKEGARSCS